MAKCRGLLQENQELGKQISQGRVTQLEAEITLHKKYNQEVKHAQEGNIYIYIRVPYGGGGLSLTILAHS